jgi:hypothetical protein
MSLIIAIDRDAQLLEGRIRFTFVMPAATIRIHKSATGFGRRPQDWQYSFSCWSYHG